MFESESLNTLAEMLQLLFPEAVKDAMAKHDQEGGSVRVELPPTNQHEELLTYVKFEPGSTAALFKLGEDPAQVIWGQQIPDAEAFLACVRVDGALQTRLYELDGTFTPLSMQPGAAPYDFGDVPVTELIDGVGSRSDGQTVRERVCAAQRDLLGTMQTHVDSMAG